MVSQQPCRGMLIFPKMGLCVCGVGWRTCGTRCGATWWRWCQATCGCGMPRRKPTFSSVSCWARLVTMNCHLSAWTGLRGSWKVSSCCYAVQYNIVAKCQYSCTRNVSWCQIHSSCIHANHRTSLNYSNSKHWGKKSRINKYLKNPSDTKLCVWHQSCLFTRSTS